MITAVISDFGGVLTSPLLGALSDRQLRDLFSGARFDRPYDLITPVRPVSDWVRVFKKRVKAVSEGPPCPAA